MMRYFLFLLLIICALFSNAQTCINHKFKEGTCKYCGIYGTVKKIVANISTKEELINFSKLINSRPKDCYVKVVENDINVVYYYVYAEVNILADIVLNNNVLDEDGDLIRDRNDLFEWIPIGYNKDINDDGIIEKVRLCGIFNGNGHTISGVYINQPNEDNQGFIYAFNGECEKANNITEISNLGIVDSYICGRNYVGAIAGYSYKANFKNCFSTAKVVGDNWVNNICGKSDFSNFENCYYIFGNDDNSTKMEKSQILSGELTYKLNGNQSNIIWGQNIGIDKYPKSYNGKNKVKIIYSN